MTQIGDDQQQREHKQRRGDHDVGERLLVVSVIGASQMPTTGTPFMSCRVPG